VKRQSGGLVLLRRITPLARRDAVYFCSGAYNVLTVDDARRRQDCRLRDFSFF